jgi:hypothetical protein
MRRLGNLTAAGEGSIGTCCDHTLHPANKQRQLMVGWRVSLASII